MLVVTVLVSGVFPVTISIIANKYFANWFWIGESFHAFIEGVGAFSAIMLTILFLMSPLNKETVHFLWIACALLGMGILDGFHASVPPGETSIWLRSISTLFGGFLFALVWLPARRTFLKSPEILIWAVLIIASAFDGYSVLFPESLPKMMIDGNFALTAKILNFMGGILFLVAGAYFVIQYCTTKENDDLLFVNLCLLFGMAGLLFHMSSTWNADWWIWHFLRLTAYLHILGYVFMLSQRRRDELQKAHDRLELTEAMLRKRTHDLGARAKEMTCLYGVHHLLDNTNMSIERKFQKIVDIIPPGWQYPGATCARIIYQNKMYKTNNFHETQWRQKADIIVRAEKVGTLEVCYLEEKPQRDIGPFLKEEKELIETLAKNIEEYIEYEQTIDQLRYSEERLKILFESAPDAIYLNDLKGNLVDANEAAQQLTGYTKEDLIGKNMLESNLLSASQIPKAVQLLAKNSMRKPTGPDEFALKRKDGTKVVVEISTFPIKIQDKRVVLGIARDITERRKAEQAIRDSEEKYRTIFEESKDAIYVSTRDGKFLDINPAGVQLFGYDSLEELMSVNIQEAIYTDSNDRKKFQEILNKQGAVMDYEIKLKKKNGQKLIVLVTSSAIKNEDGNITGYRGIIRDITKQKELERQLLQAQKMEAIGTLAGGIAHDFNNILSAILGYTELTKEIIKDDGMISRNLEQVYKAGLRAKDLILQILAFSRRTDHKPQPLQIELILKEALKLMRASLPATIEICQNFNSNGAFTLADPTQMHQVVMNLCTNAYDAMRDKGGLLDVNLGIIQVNGDKIVDNPDLPIGDYIKISISDTGMGMDRETAKRVFDPFFTTKDAGTGTGLGLSVVHGIVKRHGGDITVQSEPGKGTTFNVYIPQFKSKVEMSSQTEPEFLKGSESILLVDDEEPIVESGVRILGKLGYQVTGKTQSLEALEAFKQSPDQFDIIITDLTMPNMTGLALAQNILKIRPDIPIILITGFNENVTKDIAKKMGIRDLIMKPILTPDLSKIIRATLDTETVGS